MKRKVFTYTSALSLAFSLLSVSTASAQDLHFSQFYSTLTNVNPGATGAFGGDIRFLSNYRTQWNSINQPYKTIFASVDVGMFKYKNEEGSGSFPAVGISFLNDVAGEGDLKLTEIALSASYNLKLGKDNTVSAGFRVGNASRTINYAGLRWDSQFDPGTGVFDPNAATGEPRRNDNFSYTPISAGLLWNFSIPDRLRVNLGGAMNRLNEPDAAFTDDGKDPLNSQTVIHSSMEILFNKTDLSLLPQFLYMTQGDSKEMTVGVLAKYLVSFDSKFTGYKQSSGIYGGVLLRSDDAIIFTTRIDLRNNLAVGISYDFDTTPLQDVTGRSGALEFMLLYNGFFKRETHLPRKGSPQFL